jgi:hypothetical protein
VPGDLERLVAVKTLPNALQLVAQVHQQRKLGISLGHRSFAEVDDPPFDIFESLVSHDVLLPSCCYAQRQPNGCVGAIHTTT